MLPLTRRCILTAAAIALAASFTACQHAQRPITSTSVVAGSSRLPYHYTPPSATFSSSETGTIVLSDVGGNAHQCYMTKIFIGIPRAKDAAIFVGLIRSRRVLPRATVKWSYGDGGSSARVLRDVKVTGKSTSGQYPIFTLTFSSFTASDCH